jgi:predicted nucleotidyltransferase
VSRIPAGYEDVLNKIVEEARADDEIVGILLTGSVARGDALPGTDIDLRFILVDGASRAFDSRPRNGILIERGFADLMTAQTELRSNSMNVYAYLDGRILYDPFGVLASLNSEARKRFDEFEVSKEERARTAFLLGCARDKIRVAMDGGDLLRAAFVAGTTSWGIIEGLWAASNRPLPPNSSVRPHLCDLVGPPDIQAKYERLFLADTPERVRVTLELLDWIIARPA